MTTAERKPTTKQAQVLGLVKQGKTPKQIAKSMKISRNGVYAHLRKLRELGLIEIEPTTSSENGSSNGHSPEDAPTPAQIKALARHATEKADERVEQINGRIIEIESAQDELNAEREKLASEQDELIKQRQALQAV